MKRGLFIILMFVSMSVGAQTIVPQVGETYFRYKASLTDSIPLFKNIKFQDYQFPCVDEFILTESSLPRTEIEFVTDKNFKEYYSYEAGVLNFIGYNGNDPFLSIPNSFIQFFKEVPVARSNRKDDFFDKGETDFFVNYKVSQLPEDLRKWAEEEGIKEIILNAAMAWNNGYKRNDSFDDLWDKSVGYVVRNERRYFVKSIEVKKQAFELIDFDAFPILEEFFSDKLYVFDSFYPFGTVKEKARISHFPDKYFYYQTEESLGQFTSCRHLSNDIYVYPNPTYNDIYIRFENALDTEFNISLYNIIGKKLWGEDLTINQTNDQVFVNLPELSKGVYIYTISNSAGKRIQSRRLVVIEP